MKKPDLTALEQEIINLTSVPGELRDFYRDVFSILLETVYEPPNFFIPSRRELDYCVNFDKPLLSAMSPRAFPEALRGEVERIIGRLSQVLQRHSYLVNGLYPGAVIDMAGLTAGASARLGKMTEECGLLISRLPPDQLREAMVSPEAFISLAALVPFYVAYGQALAKGTGLERWIKGYCPVCGLRPSMAKLVPPEGRRVMECWFCATQWEFPRLKCPFCGNDRHQHLGIYYLEDDPAARAYYCDVCGYYLKVIDGEKRARDTILALENLATWQLDLAVQGKGYLPGALYAPLPGFPRY